MSRMTMIQKMRSVLTGLCIVLAAGTAFGQGTVMPPPVFTGLDSSGNPLVSGKLCTYVAGTSTPATTYTTSALNVANTNPVILSAAGRATVFLRPGSSYKFVLYSAGADQTCSTGTLQWSQDNISALPTSNVNLDFDGTAGESLAAGDVVYLKDSTGWYKADADAAATSSEAAFIGMVPSAIASGSTGTIRIKGLVTVTGPLTVATAYYVSATAGGVTSTAPTLVRHVGVGYTSTSMLVSPANEGKLPSLTSSYLLNGIALQNVASGRLSLTTNTCVTTADVTAATTIYFTPGATTSACRGNQIALYTAATNWQVYTFTQQSIALGSDAANTPYDVYAYLSAGAVAIERLAWTNTTTRATALGTQDGVDIKSGDPTRRYLGTYNTTAVVGQTEDSFQRRLVWNVNNRVERILRRNDSTDTWDYTTAAWRQAGANTANQVEFVIGKAEIAVLLEVDGYAFNSGGGGNMVVGIGLDTVAAPTTGFSGGNFYSGSNGIPDHGIAKLKVYPAIGFHYAAWLEYSVTTSGTSTWKGDAGIPTLLQAGISGTIWG